MTIIVGIVCKDAIVLASDSQTTYNSPGGEATQRLDSPKITVVEFSNDRPVLVAQSGEVTLSSRAVEIFTDMGKGKDISDYRTAADIAQKSMRQLKDELREQNFGCSMEQLHEYIRKEALDFALMIAYYHDAKPYIFTINFAVGIATKSVHPFIAIGCGSGIATYILSWFNISPQMLFTHAVLAALYTIEEVKKVDPYCGGKAKFAIIGAKIDLPKTGEFKSASEIVQMMLRAEHDDHIAALAKIDQKAKAEWAARMNEVMIEGHRTMQEKRNQQKSQ